jgi:molecular chaperone DnaK (HSP70)
VSYALGIDVGTTFTAAALWRDGRAEACDLGARSTVVPSVLFLRDDGVTLVGEAAEQRAVSDPSRVAREFKRRFGDDVPVLLGESWVTPTELTADMIRYVLEKVVEREAEAPGYVLLTHPATWSDHRMGQLEAAAGMAGLSGVGMLPEPVSAAIFYAARERVPSGSLVGVYDLGGGTFDATVLRKTDGGFELVGAPGGDEELGGVDVDAALLDHVCARRRSKLGQPRPGGAGDGPCARRCAQRRRRGQGDAVQGRRGGNPGDSAGIQPGGPGQPRRPG